MDLGWGGIVGLSRGVQLLRLLHRVRLADGQHYAGQVEYLLLRQPRSGGRARVAPPGRGPEPDPAPRHDDHPARRRDGDVPRWSDFPTAASSTLKSWESSRWWRMGYAADGAPPGFRPICPRNDWPLLRWLFR